MKWRSFKDDPPYDALNDSIAGMEVDAIHAYFIFRYTHSPMIPKDKLYISWGPCKFWDGVFEGYESHMRTSPFPMDRIEVLYWVEREEAAKAMLLDFKCPDDLGREGRQRAIASLEAQVCACKTHLHVLEDRIRDKIKGSKAYRSVLDEKEMWVG